MTVATRKNYRINMIRVLRADERKRDKRRVLSLSVAGASFGLLALAVLHAVLTVLTMEGILETERLKLHRLQEEYKKYTATRLIVDKADIELLDRLQGDRVFWTRKLAAMALHLPEEYWITHFEFAKEEFKVEGYGYISPKQEQLMTLDQYLNLLREDSTFSDVFKSVYFNSTQRQDEGTRQRVSFEYSALAPPPLPPAPPPPPASAQGAR